ncbi:MAG: SUMF1/EgtB/PvdO family nonheme iron enzyme [Myxococcota bacterium]
MTWILLTLAAASPMDCGAVEAPSGMACIPGGPATVGSDADPASSPAHVVNISTFFMDVHEVTNADYRACVRAGVCPSRKPLPGSYRSFLKPEQPAVPIKWDMARAYCVWAGKRLPTEAEWEKVARGGDDRAYPWGNDAPSCERAHYKGCEPSVTRNVGDLPVGPYGVYDMAGNGYEWVNDYATACYDGCEKSCGDACTGDDPQGPCAGLPYCPGHRHRVLKGGSWYWPEDHLRSSQRRSQRPVSGLHRFSFRCASDTATLTHAPYWHLESRPPPPVPEPPTAAQLELANAVRNDSDVQKTCSSEGVANLDCRDPMSYVLSNEARRGLFKPYIENLGGAYAGLGADQGYDFIATARSQWAWLFDYDPTVVRVHGIIHSILPHAETRRDFVAAWTKPNLRRTRGWIREALTGTPDEIEPTLRVFRRYRERLLGYYRRNLNRRGRAATFGWLANDERYAYVRTLVAQGRIIVRTGNLLVDGALKEIGAAARELKVPIRVYYESNASEQWPLPEQFRANIESLPFDDRSLALRTIHGERYELEAKWLYVVHAATHLQRFFERKNPPKIRAILQEASDTKLEHLKVVRLPTAGGPMGNAVMSHR